LERVHRLYKKSDIKFIDNIDAIPKSLDIAYHKFIKQITNDLEILNFNVAISQMMIYINRCYNHQVLNKTHAQNFLIVLSCFAPHLAEEL
jgi:leucyl-tRNA synthetase